MAVPRSALAIFAAIALIPLVARSEPPPIDPPPSPEAAQPPTLDITLPSLTPPPTPPAPKPSPAPPDDDRASTGNLLLGLGAAVFVPAYLISVVFAGLGAGRFLAIPIVGPFYYPSQTGGGGEGSGNILVDAIAIGVGLFQCLGLAGIVSGAILRGTAKRSIVPIVSVRPGSGSLSFSFAF